MMDVVVVGCGASGVAALRRLHDAGLRVLGLEAADRIGGRICTVNYADNVVDLGAQWNMMDVVVVGCGASGVAALRRLHDAGLRVLGLEAADRIGGRICTVNYADNVVDLGAQWCDGEKDNVVFELVEKLAVLGRPQPNEQVFLLSDGNILPTDVGGGMMKSIADLLAKADKNTNLSIPEYLSTAIKELESTQKDPELLHAFLELYNRLNNVGSQKDRRRWKSIRGLEEYWPCEGESFLNWKDKGFKTLLDILLKKYPNPQEAIPVEILLNKEVETINWKPTEARADTATPFVQIKCKDGSLYSAKAVIITVSVGVLKERHSKLFSPPLPEEKVNIINSLEMCVLDKIYIQFSKPWWTKHPSFISIIWRPEDKAKLSEDEWWISEIYGFSTVEQQPNVLCGWTYSEGAKAMESKSSEAVKEGVLKVLNMMFKKNFTVSTVVDVLRTKWASNALTRGSYSYRCVDTEMGSSRALSEPLQYNNTPVVCFAGEGTSYHRSGNVHGAVEAGFREADRIIEHLKNN